MNPILLNRGKTVLTKKTIVNKSQSAIIKIGHQCFRVHQTDSSITAFPLTAQSLLSAQTKLPERISSFRCGSLDQFRLYLAVVRQAKQLRSLILFEERKSPLPFEDNRVFNVFPSMRMKGNRPSCASKNFSLNQVEQFGKLHSESVCLMLYVYLEISIDLLVIWNTDAWLFRKGQ